MQMPTEPIENSAHKISRKVICQSCGEKFSCGAAVEKCWCFSIETKAEVLTELREEYDECLCRKCLEQPHKRQTKTSSL